MKPIAILGCGPAGLVAAHAVGMTGHPIAIFSQPVKSVISGAQFMHKPIPRLTNDEPDFTITFSVAGSPETYQRKVYASTDVPFVSFSNVHDGMTQDAWSLPMVYERLWDSLEGNINDQRVTPDWLEGWEDRFDAVVSTVPMPALCRGNHHFASAEIKVSTEQMATLPENTVHYDGTDDRSWYRCSNIQGFGGTEWGGHVKPPYPNLVTIKKPIRTNCDCWPGVFKVGRYGEWKKGELVHDAFYKTLIHLHESGMVDLTRIPS